MKKYTILLVIFVAVFATTVANAQEGFGTSNPDPSSVIDMTSTNKGVLMPRVALTSITDIATVPSPANALTVFNTATAGTAPNNVTPGFYYWSTASSRWVRLATRSDETQTSLTQNTAAGTITYTAEDGNPDVANIHWKLNANGTGLSTQNNTASGISAIALGGGLSGSTPVPNAAAGDFTTISGGGSNYADASYSTVSGGFASEAIADYATISGGRNNSAEGTASTVSGGSYNIAPSYHEWVGGYASTSYSAQSATGWNTADRLFNIGNGTSPTSKSDAFTVLKSGKTGVGFSNFETTTYPEMLQVNGNARLATLPAQTGAATDKVVVTDSNGVLKTVKSAMPKIFYMPAVIFDTSNPSSTTVKKRNLYLEYVAQFTGKKFTANDTDGGSINTGVSSGTFISSAGAPAEIPYVPAPTDLYYYITYYDTTVFSAVSIDANGVLSYKIIGSGTEASYMNIVFVVK